MRWKELREKNNGKEDINGERERERGKERDKIGGIRRKGRQREEKYEYEIDKKAEYVHFFIHTFLAKKKKR